MVEGFVPQFVIKATDAFAVETIRDYLRQCWRENLFAQSNEVTKALAEIIAWQQANPDRVRLPDHKHVPHKDERPHSRACGIRQHEHGPDCSDNCPTCQGR